MHCANCGRTTVVVRVLSESTQEVECRAQSYIGSTSKIMPGCGTIDKKTRFTPTKEDQERWRRWSA